MKNQLTTMETASNYYGILQISPEAEDETVHRVYRVLAQRFHPDNNETGDVERFLAITAAYKVLGDPELRAQYDCDNRESRSGPMPVFMSPEFTDGLESEANLRLGVLCLLYMRRRQEPHSPNVSMLDLEGAMCIPRDHLYFATWFLRSKKFILQDDRSALSITAEGVEFLETRLPHHRSLYEAFRGNGHPSGLPLQPRLEASRRAV